MEKKEGGLSPAQDRKAISAALAERGDSQTEQRERKRGGEREESKTEWNKK